MRGDRQKEGVDFFDMYAPVVSWSTVRLLLTLSVIHDLETQQVDYTNAFVQADLHDDEMCILNFLITLEVKMERMSS